MNNAPHQQRNDMTFLCFDDCCRFQRDVDDTRELSWEESQKGPHFQAAARPQEQIISARPGQRSTAGVEGHEEQLRVQGLI